MGLERKKRVAVGLSGGVDSSTAAALLAAEGYEVAGFMLRVQEAAGAGAEAAADARAVCARLGVPFYALDETERFEREVVRYFAEEYARGRTPNPCAVCNARLKFGAMLERALAIGADYVATGHYARVERGAEGRFLLRKGKDAARDQSYFLAFLSQEQLSRALFPLGGLTKTEVRELARRLGLPTAGKGESREVCFVPGKDYRRFLRERGLVPRRPGEVVDAAGRRLGRHEGVAFFTVGQRRGLGVAAGSPRYVAALDAENNRVVIGGAEELLCRGFCVERCNWIALADPSEPFEATVKIRYKHPGAPARVIPRGRGEAEVIPNEPLRAVTPGQAAVFYKGDLVLGGGWIRNAWR